MFCFAFVGTANCIHSPDEVLTHLVGIEGGAGGVKSIHLTRKKRSRGNYDTKEKALRYIKILKQSAGTVVHVPWNQKCIIGTETFIIPPSPPPPPIISTQLIKFVCGGRRP